MNIGYNIMNHNRDDKEVGMAHKVKSPKNQPKFSQTTIGQYWLGKTKLSDQPEMLLKSCHGILKKTLLNGIFYWLTN